MSEDVDPQAEAQPQSAPSGSARRRWLIAMLLMALTAAISVGAVIMSFPDPHYRAEAFLRIQSRAPYVAFRGNHLEFEPQQVERIRSPLIIKRVLAEPDIARFPEVQQHTDPVQWLLDKISVSSTRGSELFVVSFEGPDPARSAHIVNAVVDTYSRRQSPDENMLIHGVLQLLDQDVARQAERVNKLREKLRTLSAKTDQPKPAKERDEVTLVAPISELQQEIINLHVEGKISEAQHRALADALETLKALQKVPGDSRDASVAARAEIIEKHQKEMAQLEARIARYKLREGLLRDRFGKQMESKLKGGADSASEIEILKAELAREEKIYKLISDRALMPRQEGPAHAHLLKEATPARVPLPLAERITRMSTTHVIVASLPTFLVFLVTAGWAGRGRLPPARFEKNAE